MCVFFVVVCSCVYVCVSVFDCVRMCVCLCLIVCVFCVSRDMFHDFMVIHGVLVFQMEKNEFQKDKNEFRKECHIFLHTMRLCVLT